MCRCRRADKRLDGQTSEARNGNGANLGAALDGLAALLLAGHRVALGFEAPIWTPMRVELARITGRRGGVETT